MDNNYQIKISVRNLVEFVLRSGDLDMRFMGSSRALEGTRIHQKIQKKNKEYYTSPIVGEYFSEFTLKHKVEYENLAILVEGRADGVIVKEKEVIIEEIKSTMRPIEHLTEDYNMVHWAQAKCYAYIYGLQNNLDEIQVQLVYCHLDTEEMKYFIKRFYVHELKEFFYDLINKYFIWANYSKEWNLKRDTTIKKLQFPFKQYRNGQRELAVAVYGTIKENKKIFVQAPTGIGKTISTIFPAVKALGEGLIAKIFYLTAKTITRKVAEEAYEKMKAQGLKFKTITLVAKDKICFEKDSACNPEQCKYAKGHFDRINNAIMEILKEDTFTRDVIEEYAKKYEVCPFEFSLDLTLWCDSIICDYNYVFDPRVYLKRFFMDSSEAYTILIDEAHNLVDRSREMFSAELYKSPFLNLKNVMKEKEPKISKALGKLNTFMLSMKKLCENEKKIILTEEPKEIYSLLSKFISECEEWLVKNEKTDSYEELLELYFNALNFNRIAELYDKRYVAYVELNNNDVKLKLFCLDPSYLLNEAAKRVKSAIFFSATLTPIDYFREILGGSEEDYIMRLPSPYDTNNRALLIADNISTRYRDRDRSYSKIVDYIKIIATEKKGNYLVFFPSYEYMNEVYQRFIYKYQEFNCIIQSAIMSEEEREVFLENFSSNEEQGILGFGVLGGLFSEGIDLKGDKLIGAIIVGVGLPQMCFERDIIKNYFQESKGVGYEYAYMYPGMTKVKQAAGRVIRSEQDKGTIILIDDRFTSFNYQKLFSKEWFPYYKFKNLNELQNSIKEFWNK